MGTVKVTNLNSSHCNIRVDTFKQIQLDEIRMALSLTRRLIRASVQRPLLALSSRKYADDASAGLTLTFGSPTQSYFANVSVSQVDVPSGSGNFSILPQHVPVIAVLRPGLMTIYKDGNAEKHADAARQALSSAGDDAAKAMAQIEIDACEALV